MSKLMIFTGIKLNVFKFQFEFRTCNSSQTLAYQSIPKSQSHMQIKTFGKFANRVKHNKCLPGK